MTQLSDLHDVLAMVAAGVSISDWTTREESSCRDLYSWTTQEILGSFMVKDMRPGLSLAICRR